MTKNKLHSLKFISTKYHLSVPALYQRMRKINHFQQRFMIKSKSSKHKYKWLIKPAGVKLISYKRHDSRSNSYVTRKGSKNKQPTKNDYFRLAMRLSKSNQQLTKINLSQSNVITKLMQKNAKNKRLLSYQSKQKGLPNTKQHGWIWRLFHY